MKKLRRIREPRRHDAPNEHEPIELRTQSEFLNEHKKVEPDNPQGNDRKSARRDVVAQRNHGIIYPLPVSSSLRALVVPKGRAPARSPFPEYPPAPPHSNRLDRPHDVAALFRAPAAAGRPGCPQEFLC